MWAAEANLKKDTPLITDGRLMNNEQLKRFIEKNRTACSEFDKAIEWLGTRDCKTALKECPNSTWLNWLEQKFKGDVNVTVPAGTKVTITKGREFKYALWGFGAIWDLPEEFIDENSIKSFSKENI